MYLSVIMDLYNNEVVAYQVSENDNFKLVTDTVNKALGKRKSHGTVLHSNRGRLCNTRPKNTTYYLKNIK